MNRLLVSTIALTSLAGIGLGTQTATAQTATAQATTRATPVTTANLPTPAQLEQDPGEHYRVVVSETGAPVTEAACRPFSLSAYRPNRVIARTWASGTNPVAFAEVASFATHARAVAVAKDQALGFAKCGSRIEKRNLVLGNTYRQYTRNIRLAQGETMYLIGLTLHDGATGRDRMIEEGVVATGTHVEYLSISYRNTTGAMTTGAIQRTLTGVVPALAR